MQLSKRGVITASVILIQCSDKTARNSYNSFIPRRSHKQKINFKNKQ